MDIHLDMTNCIRNQHRGHFSKLNTTMEKGMSSGRRKNKNQIYTKRKMVQRKLEL